MAQNSNASLSPMAWTELVPGSCVISSDHLGWQHLRVCRYNLPSRFQLHLPPLNAYFIVAHLANPADISVQLKGRWTRSQSVPGNVMLVSPHQETHWEWTGAIDELHFYLDPRILELAAEELDDRPVRFVDGIGMTDAVIVDYARKIQRELTSPSVCTRLYGDTMAQSLTLALLRSHSTLVCPERINKFCMSPRNLRCAIEFIEAHLSEDISIGAIAAAIGMSKFHFARSFKLATSCSPHNYVIQRRIDRAKSLLRSGDMTIVDVALAVGFASRSQFSVTFRNACGLTPNRYRFEARI
jgi:AraC family transcriptional regulator